MVANEKRRKRCKNNGCNIPKAINNQKIKRQDVSGKTIGCFGENDRTFWEKRQDISSKTIGRFGENDRTFFSKENTVPQRGHIQSLTKELKIARKYRFLPSEKPLIYCRSRHRTVTKKLLPSDTRISKGSSHYEKISFLFLFAQIFERALYVFELTLCGNLVLYRVRIFAVERQFYSV